MHPPGRHCYQCLTTHLAQGVGDACKIDHTRHYRANWAEARDVLDSSRTRFHKRLEYLFGYPIPIRMATRLHTLWLRAQLEPITFPTMPEEVEPLGPLLNWDQIFKLEPSPVMIDPCAGADGAILSALADEVPQVATKATLLNNDINTSYPTQLHFDALRPEEWAVAPTKLDIITASPPFQLLDPFLGEFVLRANLFVCMHCPSDYIANGPAYRRTFWNWYQEAGLTAELRGLPRVKGRNTRRCSWLIIFRTPELKRRIWQASVDCFTLCL